MIDYLRNVFHFLRRWRSGFLIVRMAFNSNTCFQGGKGLKILNRDLLCRCPLRVCRSNGASQRSGVGDVLLKRGSKLDFFVPTVESPLLLAVMPSPAKSKERQRKEGMTLFNALPLTDIHAPPGIRKTTLPGLNKRTQSCAFTARPCFFSRSTDKSELSQSFEDNEHLSLFATVSGSFENLGLFEATEAVAEALPALGGAEMTPETVAGVALCSLISFASFEAHPVLLESVHTIWTHAGSSSVADPRFFSFLSLVFSILLGGTFTFQYGRLEIIVRELFNEIYTLELFWYRCKKLNIGLDEELRPSMRRYIETEIFFTEDKVSPFQDGSPLLDMFDVVEARLQNGLEMTQVMKSLEDLGTAQSRRSGAATKVLPYIHWALLWAIVSVFVFTFLTFEPFTSIDEVSGPRNAVFAILCGISSSLVLAVQDLSKPIEGIYSLRREVKARLGYLKSELK